MKVSALVKGCNPIITVIQLDVRLTLQFSDLKKHCHRIITKPARTLFTSKFLQVRTRRKKIWCYNTHGQFFFGPKLSDTTAYSESHVETIKTADAFTIIIRLKYTRLINKYVK